MTDVENARVTLASLEGKLSDAMSRGDHAEAVSLRTQISDAWQHLGLAGAKATLSDLESKLSAAMAKRDKTAQEIASVGVDGAGTHGTNSAIKLAPLNKRAKLLDDDIALLRIEIRHATQALERQESAAENVRANKAAISNGVPARLVHLEIRSPDGRVLRQFHKSVEAARAALQPGYEIIGQVIGSGVVSPIGRSFMASLLDAHGDVLMEWLEARGIISSDKTVVVLPSNNRESMQ